MGAMGGAPPLPPGPGSGEYTRERHQIVQQWLGGAIAKKAFFLPSGPYERASPHCITDFYRFLPIFTDFYRFFGLSWQDNW